MLSWEMSTESVFTRRYNLRVSMHLVCIEFVAPYPTSIKEVFTQCTEQNLTITGLKYYIFPKTFKRKTCMIE